MSTRFTLQPVQTNPSPTPRHRGLAVAVGENIYYIGGTATDYKTELNESIGVVHVFNTTSNSWFTIETAAPQNCAQTYIQSAVIGSDIWVFSDYTWSCFDTVNKTWREIGVKTQEQPHQVHSFAVIGESIYYYDILSTSLEQKVYCLNTVTKEVTTSAEEGFGEHPQERTKVFLTALSDETILLYAPYQSYYSDHAKKFGEVLYYDVKEAKWARAVESLHEDPIDIDEYLYAGKICGSMIFVPSGSNEKFKLRILDLEKMSWISCDLPREKRVLITYATLVGDKIYCWLSNGNMAVIQWTNVPTVEEQKQIDQRLAQVAEKALSAIKRPVKVVQEFVADPININTALEPANLSDILIHYQMTPSFAKIFPYLDTARITESTVPMAPTDRIVMHKNLMHYLTLAWSNHFSVVLTPDIIFYTVLAEIADEILTEPDTYRHLFTDSLDKKQILTLTSDPTKLDLEQVIEGIAQNTPVDSSIFTANFSSSTIESRLAIQAAFCDAMSAYYYYESTLCGIPRVKVLGTKQDWELLEQKIHRMRTEVFSKDATTAQKMSSYLKRAEMQAHKIHTTRDPEFWKKMFSINRCVSGHTDVVDGWIVMFYRIGYAAKELGEIKYEGEDFYNYKSHISTVKWAHITGPTKLFFELKSGLLYSNIVTGDSEEDKKFPWLEPQFAHVTVQTDGSGKFSPDTFKKYIEEQLRGRDKKLMLAAYDILKDDPIEVVNEGSRQVDFRFEIVGRQIDAWKKKFLEEGVSLKNFDLTSGVCELALKFYNDVTSENAKALHDLAEKIIGYLKLDQGVKSVNLGDKLAMIEDKIIAAFSDSDYGGWVEELRVSGDATGCYEKLAEYLMGPRSAKFRKLHIKSKDFDDCSSCPTGLPILAAALRKTAAPLETLIIDFVDNWEMAETIAELCTRENGGLKHFEAASGNVAKCEAHVLRAIASSKSLETIAVNDMGIIREDINGEVSFKRFLDSTLTQHLMTNMPLNPSLKHIKRWYYVGMVPEGTSSALKNPSLRSIERIKLQDLSFLEVTTKLERLQAELPETTKENMKYLADLIEREDSPLESLEIRNAVLEFGAGSALAKALPNNKSLKTLNLNHIIIKGESNVYDMMTAITDWLESPDCKIENLDLTDILESCKLYFWGENLQRILTGLTKNNKIKQLKLAAKLDLAELDLLTEFIRTSTSLTHIKIASVDTDFTAEQKAPLVAAIKANQNLVEFISYFTTSDEAKAPIQDYD